jgi:threonine dehydratase
MTSLAAGGTPLRKSLEYCGRCGGATVYVKDESKNPFGTFKDRRCAAVLERHADKKELVLVHITSGNSGYSLGMMAKAAESGTDRKITVVNVVPKGLPKPILSMLRKCSVVEEADLGGEIITQERLAAIARRATGFTGPDDCISGVEEYGLRNGYRKIIEEVATAGVRPTIIFCPVGEGELAVELGMAALEQWGDDAPKIVGATIKQNIFAADVQFMKNPGKSVADKLVNGYSKFRELLMNLVRSGRAEISVQSERSIADEYAYLGTVGISAEPSAATAFCAAAAYGLGPNDTALIINSGWGVYDSRSIDKIWQRTLRKAMRYVAVALASIAITAGAFLYKHHIERENRFLELQRQELAMQVEWESIQRVRAEAAHTLDRDGDSSVSYEELADIYGVVSGRANNAMRGLPSYDSYVDDFTEAELKYYVRYREIGRYGGNIERDILRGMRERYLESAQGGHGREPTVGERSMRIFTYRNVRTQSVIPGGTACRFRDFDMNNPFDPSREPQCE